MTAFVVLLVAACGGGGNKNSSNNTTSSSSSSQAGAKGGTMTLLANAAPSGSPDPQVNYTLQEWQLLIITHDGLTAF